MTNRITKILFMLSTVLVVMGFSAIAFAQDSEKVSVGPP